MVLPGHSARSGVSQGFLHDKNKCSRYCISCWVWMLKGNVMTCSTLFHRELLMAWFLQSVLHLHKSVEVNISLAASRYVAFSQKLHFSFSREMPRETALAQSDLGLICVFYYKYLWSSSEDDSKRDVEKNRKKTIYRTYVSLGLLRVIFLAVMRSRLEIQESASILFLSGCHGGCLGACLLQKTASRMQLQVLGLILETAPWVRSLPMQIHAL